MKINAPYDIDESERQELLEMLHWLGMPEDSEIDICENGQAYVGLTVIRERRK